MIDKQLTCKTYLTALDEHKIVARLDSIGDGVINAIITERSELHADQHYLVGGIADRLYAYEQLGYSPEELKVIIARHTAQKLALNSVYGKCTFESLYPKQIYITTGRQHGKTEFQRQIYQYITNDFSTTKQLEAWVKHNVPKPIRSGKHPWGQSIPEIKDVIFNDPATIVFWEDGTKTVVKATDEAFDPEKGMAMAIVKKVYGNKGNYFNKIKKWTKKHAVFNLRGMIERLNYKRDQDRIQKAYNVLNSVYANRKTTKGDMVIAMEEAVGLLGQVLDD